MVERQSIYDPLPIFMTHMDRHEWTRLLSRLLKTTVANQSRLLASSRYSGTPQSPPYTLFVF